MANTVTEYIQPSYSTETNAAVAGGIQGMLGDNGYLNQVMGNWYNQTPAQGALGQYAQYDPTKLTQFTNPYVSNVVNANTQQSNQNLFENILPGVNSTFTGAGQFGSTRNMDFTNRAIRDQQQTLANTNANVLMNAQNQANTNYINWTRQGLDAGQQDYKNWYEQANFPIGALGQLATAAGVIEPGRELASVQGSADPSQIEKWLAAMTAANTTANDGNLDWLADLWG